MASSESKFSISYTRFPFHNKAEAYEFESIIHALGRALHNDDFVRKAYYSVFLDSTNFPPPSLEEIAAALQHLDQYLLVLPTISIEPFQGQSYGWMQRPHAGDTTIHLNSSLCAALAIMAANKHAKLLIACTILHEVAHTYRFNTYPDPSGYSPRALSVTGYEETIKVGSMDTVISEAGYVIEHEVFGGILYALIPEGAKGFEDIRGVHLARDHVFYDIPVQVAGNWIRNLYSQETKQLWGMEEFKVVSIMEVGYRRCKLVDLALSTHYLAAQTSVQGPPVTPTKLCRVERGQDRRPNP